MRADGLTNTILIVSDQGMTASQQLTFVRTLALSDDVVRHRAEPFCLTKARSDTVLLQTVSDLSDTSSDRSVVLVTQLDNQSG